MLTVTPRDHGVIREFCSNEMLQHPLSSLSRKWQLPCEQPHTRLPLGAWRTDSLWESCECHETCERSHVFGMELSLPACGDFLTRKGTESPANECLADRVCARVIWRPRKLRTESCGYHEACKRLPSPQTIENLHLSTVDR